VITVFFKELGCLAYSHPAQFLSFDVFVRLS